MNKEEWDECKKAYLSWSGTKRVRDVPQLWEGWLACYSWIINNNKRAFDEMLDEMYNSYKQENFGGKDEP